MNCEFCQSPVHIWFQCPKKPDGWKPARLAAKSTAARKDVQAPPDIASGRVSIGGTEEAPPIHSGIAGTQALPVDTNSEPQLIAASNPQGLGPVTRKDTGVVALKPKRGRPSTGFDKRAYNRQYMADRRAGKR